MQNCSEKQNQLKIFDKAKGVKVNFMVVLICISLINSDAEQLFSGLLPMHIFKWFSLSVSSDHFSIGVFTLLLIDCKMKEINYCLSYALFPNLSFVFQSCLWHFLLYGNFSFLWSQICQSSLLRFVHFILCLKRPLLPWDYKNVHSYFCLLVLVFHFFAFYIAITKVHTV